MPCREQKGFWVSRGPVQEAGKSEESSPGREVWERHHPRSWGEIVKASLERPGEKDKLQAGDTEKNTDPQGGHPSETWVHLHPPETGVKTVRLFSKVLWYLGLLGEREWTRARDWKDSVYLVDWLMRPFVWIVWSTFWTEFLKGPWRMGRRKSWAGQCQVTSDHKGVLMILHLPNCKWNVRAAKQHEEKAKKGLHKPVLAEKYELLCLMWNLSTVG